MQNHGNNSHDPGSVELKKKKINKKATKLNKPLNKMKIIPWNVNQWFWDIYETKN